MNRIERSLILNRNIFYEELLSSNKLQAGISRNRLFGSVAKRENKTFAYSKLTFKFPSRFLRIEHHSRNLLEGGASSVVHLLRCRETGRFYAGKRIPKKSQGNQKIIRSEISILMRLKHPHVIALYKIYETPADVTLLLEYLTGGELFDRIVQKGFYSEKDAMHAMRQIFEALKYLHENGIVHRDLKPENLLYENEQPNSRLKIADFGLSKITAQDVTMQTLCGTPGYCAPEVIQQKIYSAAVDLWSAGVIAYILLCGYEPFHDDRGTLAIFQRVLNGVYEFDSPWWDEISMSAKDLISQLLQVDPKQRPSTSQALSHAWLRQSETRESHLENTVSKLKNFNDKRKLRATTKVVLTVQRVLHGFHGATNSSHKEVKDEEK